MSHTVVETPFLGQIIMFAGDYEPRTWKFCNGQLLKRADYQLLYQIIGTLYGTEGEDNFRLPNLMSRAPMHWGLIPGVLGGQSEVNLGPLEMPFHRHSVAVDNDPANATLTTPTDKSVLGAIPSGFFPKIYADRVAGGASMNFVIQDAGESQAHPNEQPYLAINFLICVVGIYPPPS